MKSLHLVASCRLHPLVLLFIGLPLGLQLPKCLARVVCAGVRFHLRCRQRLDLLLETGIGGPWVNEVWSGDLTLTEVVKSK